MNSSKGEGGILLNSYKVVEIFVHIIYGSTFGVYEKVLGISRPENFFLNFHTSPALHRGGLFLGLSACNFISFLSMWYIFFVISLKNWFLKIFFNLFGSMLV